MDNSEDPICGVTFTVDQPDGPEYQYTCLEPPVRPGSGIIHHDSCGQHHNPDIISCDETAEVMAIDQDLMRMAH